MLTVVIGPPCAGKTTYVHGQRMPDDVVIDLDALALAFGALDARRPSSSQRTAAWQAREAALNVLYRQAYDGWLIHCQPKPAALATYASRGAVVVTLDPGAEVCHARATADKRPRWTHEAIDAWYEDASELAAVLPPPSRSW